MRPLTQTLHFSESLILLVAGYFFWYPSSFPATTSASGIEQGEWLWLVGVIIFLAVFWLILRGAIQVPSLWDAPGLILIPLAYLFLLWQVFSSGGIATQVDRADYIPLLALLIPVMLLRLATAGRLWTRTPLDGFLLAFIVLCLLNVEYAPYPSRGWQMIARPLLGMALLVHLVESTRMSGKPVAGLWVMVALSFLVGWMALGSTQWTSKSADFQRLIDVLPHTAFFFAPGGFNPNEIAGALTWLVPLMGGLMFYIPNRYFAKPGPPEQANTTPMLILWRGLTGGVFLLLLLALMLGQSRAAIIGVLVALVGIALLIVPVGRFRLRYWALAGIALLLVIQASVTFTVFSGTDGADNAGGNSVGLSPRDERTTAHRLAIWNSALDMVLDHPLTGVGMNRFRLGAVRADYPIEKYPQLFAPHAHNEFIQVATDLGVPGLLVYTGWTTMAACMLWVCWRDGDKQARVVTTAVGGGLLAHTIYGMGDAIPLWDRFSFIYWLMLGLAAAQYYHIQSKA